MSITAPRRGSIHQGLKPCTVSMVGSHTGAPDGTFVPDTLLELDPESPPDTLLELTPENLLELTGEPAGTHRRTSWNSPNTLPETPPETLEPEPQPGSHNSIFEQPIT